MTRFCWFGLVCNMLMIVLRVGSTCMSKNVVIEDKYVHVGGFIFMFVVVLRFGSEFVDNIFVIVSKYVHGRFCLFE